MANPYKGMKPIENGYRYVPERTSNQPFNAPAAPFDPKGIYPNLLGARGLHPGPEGNKTPTMDLLNKVK